MLTNKELITKLDSEIKELEEKIAELTLKNEITKLNIQKKEILKLKRDLDESK